MVSCSKDENIEYDDSASSNEQLNQPIEFRQDNNSNSDISSLKQTVLGSKRTNPYSISNINIAAQMLYGNQRFSATHEYVKFSPTTQDHLADLNQWAHEQRLAVFDYPLEYEVVEEGDYYVDPEVSDPVFTYQYAVIPMGRNFPSVPFIIIEEIYLDQSNPFVLAQSFKNTGHEDDILSDVLLGGIRVNDLENLEGYNFPNNPNIDCPPGCEPILVIDDTSILGDEVVYVWECDCSGDGNNNPPSQNDCGCDMPSDDRIPAGCLQVMNDQGNFEEVKIAKIKLKNNWYSSDIVFTDEQGCWEHDERFSKRISLQVIFENDNLKVRNTGYWWGLKVTRNRKREIPNPPYNNILTQFDEELQRREWACSHTLNADIEYRNAVTFDGVPLPRTRINYLLHAGEGSASAAMLQNNPFNSWAAFLAAFKFPLIGILTTKLHPDITNQYGRGESASSVKDVNSHELGHASHYSLVGENYWVGYRNHIISNGGYGEFGNFNPGSDPGKVALGEAIGNYTQQIYGYINGNDESEAFENGFIPTGLMFDLVDDMPDIIIDPITGNSVQDNVSGFTPRMIFNALTPNITDIRQFRNRLRALHFNDTNNNIFDYNNLTNAYDVFN